MIITFMFFGMAWALWRIVGGQALKRFDPAYTRWWDPSPRGALREFELILWPVVYAVRRTTTR